MLIFWWRSWEALLPVGQDIGQPPLFVHLIPNLVQGAQGNRYWQSSLANGLPDYREVGFGEADHLSQPGGLPPNLLLQPCGVGLETESRDVLGLEPGQQPGEAKVECTRCPGHHLHFQKQLGTHRILFFGAQKVGIHVIGVEHVFM